MTGCCWRKTFAERQLAASLAALENARNEAQRQQLYLETLVQPNLPDKAIEPRRLRTVAMVFLLGLIVWGC
jgi:capsular polysaccharide transport system permease protein